MGWISTCTHMPLRALRAEALPPLYFLIVLRSEKLVWMMYLNCICFCKLYLCMCFIVAGVLCRGRSQPKSVPSVLCRALCSSFKGFWECVLWRSVFPASVSIPVLWRILHTGPTRYVLHSALTQSKVKKSQSQYCLFSEH